MYQWCWSKPRTLVISCCSRDEKHGTLETEVGQAGGISHEEAIFRAASAADVVESAETYDRLEDAIGTALVIGTSAKGSVSRGPWLIQSRRRRKC